MNGDPNAAHNAARFARLRERAEAYLRDEQSDGIEISLDEARQLIHELDVYRVELEMQNDELIHTQEELLESRAEYSDLYNHAPVGYLSLDGKGVIQRANTTLASMLQLTPADLLRQPLGVYVARQDKEMFYRHYGNFVRSGRWQDFEVRLRRQSGDVFWTQLSANTSSDGPDGERVYRIAVIDIEDKRAANERQRNLAAAIDRAAEGFCITGPSGAVEYMNAAFAAFAQCEPGEARGARVQTLLGLADADLAPFQTHPYDGVFLPPDLQLPGPGGRMRTLKTGVSRVSDTRGAVTNYVVLLRDITHEQELERRLRQSHKMEAIGTLAGGIAHDFNNMLSPIIGYAQLTLANVDDEDNQRNLREVVHAAQRASELVQRILTFSRDSDQEWELTHVANVLTECAGLLRGSLPATIAIETDLRPTPPVLGDASNLHQVIMNLCTNAYHAMREKGGVLTLGLDSYAVAQEESTSFARIGPGRYACITVRDTGEGMDAAMLERIFEPYFTTKDPREGTGMGLSTVHGIVTQHGGEVVVESAPGSGTTFRVLLPLATDAVSAESPAEDKPPESEPPCHGAERILFVDDEPSIVRLSKLALSAIGYEVGAFQSGAEALEAFRKDPAAYDVIVSDQTMPTVTGLEFAREARALRPDIVFILCSGFSEAVTDDSLRESGVDTYMTKPVKPRELAARVRQLLDSRVTQGPKS